MLLVRNVHFRRSDVLLVRELTMRLRRSNKLLVRELERHDARS